MRNNNLSMLRTEVEQTFARKILTAADCTQLCVEIFNKTGFKLNSNTIRRCFGLVKSEYPPSLTTINILASFCGFTSFDEFVEYKTNKARIEPQGNKSLLSYLTSLFKSLEADQRDNATYTGLIRHTIEFFKDEPEVIYLFQKEISRTRSGQEYYFEEHVNIDRLAGYYGEGLRYYLAEKKSAEAQIFGNALLAFKCWLVQDVEGLVKHYSEVIQHPLHPGMHPFVQARHFATRLFYAETMHKDPVPIIAEASLAFKNLKHSFDHYRHFPCFQLVLADALVLTGAYEEALFYAASGVGQLRHQGTVIQNFALFNALPLLQAFALAETGNLDKAKAIFVEIDPAEFYFLSKKYLTTLYLLLTAKLNKSKVQQEQLQFLVKDTGFQRMRQLPGAKKAALGVLKVA